MTELERLVNQAISDLDAIEEAIISMGVPVPKGTDTKEYAKLIRKISGGGSGETSISVRDDVLVIVSADASVSDENTLVITSESTAV